MAMNNFPEDRSPFWSIGAVGAIGAGVGFGMKGRWGGIQSTLSRPPMSPVFTALQSAMGNMPGFKPPGQTNVVAMDLLGDLATSPASKSSLRREIAHATYESLMKSTSIGHTQAYNIFQRINRAGSVTDAYSMAAQNIARHSARADMFERQIEKLVPGGFFNARTQDIPGPEFMGQKGSFGFFGKAGTLQRVTSLTDPVEMQRAVDLRTKLEDIFGKDIARKSRLYIVGEEGFPMLRLAERDVNISLPLREGMTYGGKGFQTRYITRGAYTLGPSGPEYSSFSEVYLDEIKKSMANNRSAKEAVNEVNRSLLQNINDTEATKRMAVFASPEAFQTSGDMMSERLLRTQKVFIGKQPTPELLQAAIESGELFPFAGQGAVGKMTMQSADIRQALYGTRGVSFPAERQPFQKYRAGWGLTAEAKNRAVQMNFKGSLGQYYSRLDRKFTGAGYKYLAGTGAGAAAAEAHVAPQLITMYAKPGIGGFASERLRALMAEEQGFISTNVSNMMEAERIKNYSIRVEEDMRIHRALKDSIFSEDRAINEIVNFDKPLPLVAGEDIGISLEGKSIKAGGALQEEIIGYHVIDRGQIKVKVRERFMHGAGQDVKYFDEGIKHLMGGATQEEIDALVMQEFGTADIGRNRVEAILSGSRIAKNPYALHSQQMHAMAYLGAEKFDTPERGGAALAQRKALRAYMEDPEKYLGLEDVYRGLDKGATVAQIGEANYVAQKRILQGAKELGLLTNKRGSTGLIFGLMEQEHTERLMAEGIIGEMEAAAIKGSRGVIGISSPMIGDLVTEGGAGKLAKLDVAAMRVLSMKSYSQDANLAADTMADFASRMRLADPAEKQALRKMQASLLNTEGEFSLLSGLKSTEEVPLLTSIGPDELVSPKGRYVDLGESIKELGGSRRIYIPGTEESSIMAARMGQGETIKSDLHRAVADLQTAIKMKNKAGEDSLEGAVARVDESAAALRSVGQAAYASSVVPQGEVLGSRYLTGKRMTAAQAAELGEGVVGISERTGLEMFEELERQATTESQKAFLIGQQERLLAGEAVEAMGWRHPTAGPESVQAMRMKIMPGARNEMLYFGEKMGSFQIGGVSEQVPISQMVGMKGDFDKDMYNIAVMSDKSTADRLGRAMDFKGNISYNKYLGKHYMLARAIDQNAARGASEVSAMALTKEAMSHGYAKLATGQTNIALQKLKVGIASQAPDLYGDVAPMLWHIEETAAIGAKHGLIGGGTDYYRRISQAVNNLDQTKLQGVIEDIFGKEARTMKATIDGAEVIYNYNPAVQSQQMMDALAGADKELIRSVELGQMAKRSTGAGSLLAHQEQFLMAEAGLSEDAGMHLLSGKQTYGQKMQRTAKSLGRNAKSIARVLSRAKKPIAMGLAAASAIMLAAPSISGSLSNPNIEGAGGGKNIDAASSVPPNQTPTPEPPSQIMRSPKVYQQGSSRISANYSTSDYQSNYSDTMKQIAAMRGAGQRTRMNISDNREYLDPHMLANKIHERM